MAWHGVAMPGSYVAVFTGFYVDNGPQLPLWDRLPHLAYWLLPAMVGASLTWLALRRNAAIRGGNPGRTHGGGPARVLPTHPTADPARLGRLPPGATPGPPPRAHPD